MSQATRNMEATDDHLDAGGAEGAGEIDARGNSFDCTPTIPTNPKPPLSAIGA